jgi:hypothetical protein
MSLAASERLVAILPTHPQNRVANLLEFSYRLRDYWMCGNLGLPFREGRLADRLHESCSQRNQRSSETRTALSTGSGSIQKRSGPMPPASLN